MTESTVIKRVRERCVVRDGYCRLLPFLGSGKCSGPSEWAHFDKWKRWRTMGQDPEARHCTQGSLMLCQLHHRLYDDKYIKWGSANPDKLVIYALSDRYADGPLGYILDGVVYEEAA